MKLDYWPVREDTIMAITPAIDATTASGLQLSFKEFGSHYATPYTIQIQVSTDGGITWDDPVWSISPTTYVGPEIVTVDLSAYDGQTINIAWVFVGITNNMEYWNIDDISVTTVTHDPTNLIKVEQFSEEEPAGATGINNVSVTSDKKIQIIVSLAGANPNSPYWVYPVTLDSSGSPITFYDCEPYSMGDPFMTDEYGNAIATVNTINPLASGEYSLLVNVYYNYNPEGSSANAHFHSDGTHEITVP